MKELLLQSLIFAYACVGVFAAIGYWPTIRDLYHHKKPSANITSYILWTATSGIAFLYSIFILPDLLFRIVSGINFLSCGTILILSISLLKNK